MFIVIMIDELIIDRLDIILRDLNIKFNNILLLNKDEYISKYKVNIDNNDYIIHIQFLNINKNNVLYYEYMLLKSFNNKNIIKFANLEKYMYYKQNNYIFIITENLYETLSERLIKKKFTEDEVKNIGIQLINTIKYIHSEKYLYLGLDPDNIMFENEANVLKLTNFNSCSTYINIYSEFYNNIKLINKKEIDEEILFNIKNKTISQNMANKIYFNSININNSYSGVRINDLESILWIMLLMLEFRIIKTIKKQSSLNGIMMNKKRFMKNCETYIKNVNHDFIKKFIELLLKYDNNNNRKPNYDEFIDILKDSNEVQSR